ncbi:hypothetical protein [Mixta gaviniae]
MEPDKNCTEKDAALLIYHSPGNQADFIGDNSE